MDRYAILTDAGYFFAAGGAALLPGQGKIKRATLALKNHEALLMELRGLCDPLCVPASLLRMYWYDAPPRGLSPSSEQESIGRLPGVKLRLGNLNNQGEQKCVDSLIITDLVDLARNAAVSDVVLISGDEDLRIGVSIAQGYGVRVHLLGVGDVAHNTSPRLLMESDGQIVADQAWVKNVIEVRPGTVPTPTADIGLTSTGSTATTGSAVLSGAGFQTVVEQIIEEVIQARTPSEISALKSVLVVPRSSIPPEYDGKLLARIGGNLGRKLDQSETSLIRRLFRERASR